MSAKRTAAARELEKVCADLERLTARRNVLIAKRRTEGASFRVIAEETGLHHSGVEKIVRLRQAEERQAATG